MCETMLINNSLVGLCKRSFAQRIDFVAGLTTKDSEILARLNGKLGKLYDLLYSSYPSVTEEDYKSFGPSLKILINTLCDLRDVYIASDISDSLKTGLDRLNKNISALTEIDSDIQNFKVNIKSNKRFCDLVKQLKIV